MDTELLTLLNEPEIFDAIQQGKMNDLFIHESPDSIEKIRKEKPKNALELLVLLALNQNSSSVKARTNLDAMDSSCFLIKKVIDPTFGKIVFTEQLIEIIRNLSGFSFEKADDIRKQLGKKDMLKLEVLYKEFKPACLKNESLIEECNNLNINIESLIENVWNWLYEEAAYLCKLSFELEYAIVIYQKAYKRIHP